MHTAFSSTGATIAEMMIHTIHITYAAKILRFFVWTYCVIHDSPGIQWQTPKTGPCRRFGRLSSFRQWWHRRTARTRRSISIVVTKSNWIRRPLSSLFSIFSFRLWVLNRWWQRSLLLGMVPPNGPMSTSDDPTMPRNSFDAASAKRSLWTVFSAVAEYMDTMCNEWNQSARGSVLPYQCVMVARLRLNSCNTNTVRSAKIQHRSQRMDWCGAYFSVDLEWSKVNRPLWERQTSTSCDKRYSRPVCK